MAQVAGLNNFNNLLYHTHKRAVCDIEEHKAGRVGLDLSYKGSYPIGELLTCGIAQVGGKRYGLKYAPTVTRNRPYYGYDARIDPTILNTTKTRYVSVSGLNIPNQNLRKRTLYKSGQLQTIGITI